MLLSDNFNLSMPDGSGHHELTHLKGGGRLPDDLWTERKIAFTAYTNKIPITATIVVIDKDGQNDTQIAEGYDPKRSPDGRQLLFTRDSARNSTAKDRSG